jgi:hypothetical protein
MEHAGVVLGIVSLVVGFVLGVAADWMKQWGTPVFTTGIRVRECAYRRRVALRVPWPLP